MPPDFLARRGIQGKGRGGREGDDTPLAVHFAVLTGLEYPPSPLPYRQASCPVRLSTATKDASGPPASNTAKSPTTSGEQANP